MEQVGIELLYDTKKAEGNNKNLTNSFTNLENQNKNSQKSGMMAMATAVAIGNVMAAGFQKLSGKMFSAIPALGETLSQAGTVIFNNLFKPLSDILVPMLKSLMNWVRDNRVGFVQLGSVISGIFQFIASVVKTVFGAIGKVLSRVFSVVSGGAKATFKNIADFMNLILLKIVFIAQFVLILLEPVFALIGDAVVFCVEQIKSMFDFIVAFIQDPKKAFEDFGVVTIGLVIAGVIALGTTLWSALVPAIWGAVAAAGAFLIAAAPLILIGVAIAGVVKAVIWVVDHFHEIWDAIKSAFGKAWEYIKDVGTSIQNFFGGIVDWIVDKFHAIVDWFKKLPEKIGKMFSDAWAKVKETAGALWDWITGSPGEIKVTADDAALAKARGGGGGGGNVSNSQNNPVNVTVNGAQNPEETAKNIVKEAQKGNSIQNKQAAQGA